MSLNRYQNRDILVDLNDPQYAQIYTDEDLSALSVYYFNIDDENAIKKSVSELHIYSFYGDYLAGDHNASFIIHEKNTKSYLIDLVSTFKSANILKGGYIIVINTFSPVIGDFSNKKCILKDISPDRTELKLKLHGTGDNQDLSDFYSAFSDLKQQGKLNNLIINFGYNRIANIVSVKSDQNEAGVFYVKLYQPLMDDVNLKDTAFFGIELFDPYVDTVVISQPVKQTEVNSLKGPNFELDTNQYMSNATVFKSWDDLLDSNLPTTQKIINSALSSSGFAKLNIDYTDLNNFIFYSSAEERINNFYYKVKKVEEYKNNIKILTESTASFTLFNSSSIDSNNKRIDQIISNFDGFENWMYYENTSSIFTHDLSGSFTPYPKYINDGAWVNHNSTSSIVVNWYNTAITQSALYDESNYNRLYWSIPEHIYGDEGNSDYVLFVEMVAQHFDVLWSYIKALTQIHERDESPKRGPSNDLLYYIAKSYGWNLQNSRQVSDLWTYKLGTDSSGKYNSTGSIFSISGENQTHQVWRRIVNNLPYLLKTKGTARSVKALMSIYGIPQTLISIKEYGGPSVDLYSPHITQDVFSYAVNFTGSNWIEFERRPLPASSGSWSGITRVPDTIEFRFKTDYSASVSMSLWAIEDGTNRSRINSNLELVHFKSIDLTGSYSGSYRYGYLRYTGVELSGSTYISSSVSTGYLPFFDNDFWTVKIWTSSPITQSLGGNINVSVAKSSDFIYGNVNFSSSLLWSGTNNVSSSWGNKVDSLNYVLLGGTTGSKNNRFVGNIQGYKEYYTVFSESIFKQHVLNPAAYFDESETGSFYTLYRYFPLGLDQQRWDHSVYNQVSSSQPNRIASYGTTASFKNFTGDQKSQYDSVVEKYYIFTPSIGGKPLIGEKVRLESSRLLRNLNPDGKSSRSTYDGESNDSNKLAIVFSPSDHVNFDIFNHSGYFELDEFMGDPQYEFDDSYEDLNRYSREYWKKYQQKNDINAYIRILSVYDYSFFEQIKQLTPAKSDLVSGILLEQNVLHRSKVRLSKRPSVESTQWEKNVGYSITESADYTYSETIVSASISPSISYTYLTSSLSNIVSSSITYNYITGSLSSFYSCSADNFYHYNVGDKISSTDAILPFTGSAFSASKEVTGSMAINHHIKNCCYKKVIYHYSASGNFSNRYEKQWYSAVSKSYGMYYSKSLECWGYQLNECAVENRSIFSGTKITSAGFNIDSPDTIDGGPVIIITENSYNSLLISNDLKVE